MQKLDVNKTADAWAPLSRTLFVPHAETQYRQLLELLDCLVDEVGRRRVAPSRFILEVAGILIEK